MGVPCSNSQGTRGKRKGLGRDGKVQNRSLRDRTKGHSFQGILSPGLSSALPLQGENLLQTCFLSKIFPA